MRSYLEKRGSKIPRGTDIRHCSLVQVRNTSNDIEKLLKPYYHQKNLSQTEDERFTTHNSEIFRDLGAKQRVENITLEKDDIRHTRRIMEQYHNKSISQAANKTFTLSCKRDAIPRLRKYVRETNKLNEDDENTADQYEWTPDRFNTLGWKYQQRGTFNQFLN